MAETLTTARQRLAAIRNGSLLDLEAVLRAFVDGDFNAIAGVTASASELNILDGVTATTAEINRAADTSARRILAGATVTLSEATHDGRTIVLDQASSSVVTLPAATGTGVRFRILVGTAPTSNNHRVLCAGSDEFAGVVYQVDTDSSDALVAYPALAADNFDTLTLNGTTTGGRVGDWIELEDVASATWAIVGHTNASGTVATPLTAA